MILLEIDSQIKITHYETLGIFPEDMRGMNDKEISLRIRKIAKKERRKHQKQAQKGDTEAEEKLININKAVNELKNREKRENYDKELESGQGSLPEILQTQPIAPPFFQDRNIRFRVIERLMQEAGLIRPIPIELP